MGITVNNGWGLVPVNRWQELPLSPKPQQHVGVKSLKKWIWSEDFGWGRLALLVRDINLVADVTENHSLTRSWFVFPYCPLRVLSCRQIWTEAKHKHTSMCLVTEGIIQPVSLSRITEYVRNKQRNSAKIERMHMVHGRSWRLSSFLSLEAVMQQRPRTGSMTNAQESASFDSWSPEMWRCAARVGEETPTSCCKLITK